MEDTAGYIRDMVQEMAQLAERNGLDFLAYLLAMAADEAKAAAEAEDEFRAPPRRVAGNG